jgi:hypothetical protein
MSLQVIHAALGLSLAAIAALIGDILIRGR